MPMPRLAPTVSTQARQTIRVAFEDLERTITPADIRTLRSTSTLQQVRTAAIEIETQLAAKQSLRNMRRLVPLLRGLEHYGKVVDVLCNGTPYLSWIWSPITLVLRVASEYVEAFEQLMKGYSRIADSLTRFEILSDAFIKDPDFQQTVAVFYADILQFHKHAYKFVRRSGWKILFLTSWGRFQRRFETILDDLKRHGELIDLEANARNIAEARQLREEILRWREESLEQVRRDEEERAARHYRYIMSWLRFEESEQLSVFETLLEEGNKFPGTCAWLIQHPKIRVWLQPRPETPFVWLQGHPGTGKSIISSQLVKFLQVKEPLVIRHFCNQSYTSSTKYEYIVRSLLLQLLRVNGELLAHVYQDCILGKKPPSITTLEQLLRLTTLHFTDQPGEVRYLWVILDGLGECEVDKQLRLLSLLNHVTTKPASDEGTVCKVLVSSRYSALLFKHLRKRQIVSLYDEIEQLNKAIRIYTVQRLQSSAERLRQLELEPEDIEDIANAITEKADGMFLYSRLVLNYLTTNIFYSRNELKESIRKLPQKLSDFYQKILTQMLAHQDSRSVERIKAILSWIAFARRPLKRFELLSAVSFNLGDPNVERPAPQYILDICSPLVGERQDTTLMFIHGSVKEFLQLSSLRINERQAISDHGMAAITCLLSGLQLFDQNFNERTRCIRLIKGVHGLHVYATEFWTEYLLSEAEATGGPNMSSPLLVMALQLVSRLDDAAATTTVMECTSNVDDNDERLLVFQGNDLLYNQLRAAMRARSRPRLEMELFDDRNKHLFTRPPDCSNQQPTADGNSHISSLLFPLDSISRMLQSYERAIKTLLHEDFYPGVSSEELEIFKNQFRTSAFTCRLSSCPRATIGFETDLLRYEHEMAHVGGFRCPYSDCKYPPFLSSRALKGHVSNCHSIVPERKSIRRVGLLETSRSSSIWKPHKIHTKQGMNMIQHQQDLEFDSNALANQPVDTPRIQDQKQQMNTIQHQQDPESDSNALLNQPVDTPRIHHQGQQMHMVQHQQDPEFDSNALVNQPIFIPRIQDQGHQVVSISNDANMDQRTGTSHLAHATTPSSPSFSRLENQLSNSSGIQYSPILSEYATRMVKSFQFALPPSIVGGSLEADEYIARECEQYRELILRSEQGFDMLNRLISSIRVLDHAGHAIPGDILQKREQAEQVVKQDRKILEEFKKKHQLYKEHSQLFYISQPKKEQRPATNTRTPWPDSGLQDSHLSTQSPVQQPSQVASRGTYELEDRKTRDEIVSPFKNRAWITVDASVDGTFLANCTDCRNGKQYSSPYNAAGHLRRKHFHPRRPGRGRQQERSANIHPEIMYLKQYWIKQIDIPLKISHEISRDKEESNN